MKTVLIVGGAGVFGRRLAEGLLAAAKARVIIAGRSAQRADRCAREIGAEVVYIDRTTVSPDTLRGIGADLIIDAAGPFQGADLHFARATIESGAHYLDLADARDFVAAFPQLDSLARERGVSAVTGASSTPALTHAVLDELCAGWRRLDVVRAGIAPANQMDRGPAVMKAILSWTGAPVRVWEGGVWRTKSGWSHCCTIDMPGLGRRRFALAETPDLDLIPQRFTPGDTALFMAGLELPLMQRGMEMMCALKRWGIVRNSARWAEVLRGAGGLLSPFGSDRGGMIVEALGRDAEDRPVVARWTMIAPDGLGPYTPTLAARILARRFVNGEPPPVGARPCVAMLRLDDFEPEFAHYRFTTRIEVAPLVAPFETALAERFVAAPSAVRAAHRGGAVTRFRGTAQVRGAQSPLTRLIARVVGFPPATPKTPVCVTMRLERDVETWERDFGGRKFKSRLRPVRPGVVRESFGPLHFDMRMDVSDEQLTMRVVGWRLGPIPLPAWLAPRSDAAETEDAEGRFHFDVPIALPLLGTLVHYSGALEPEVVEVGPTSAVTEDA